MQAPAVSTSNKLCLSEEDNRVMTLRQSNMSWDNISMQVPGRSSLFCELRYYALLTKQRYKFLPPRWNPHDDGKLRHLRDVRRSPWAEVVKELPGRSSDACQQRYSALKDAEALGKSASQGETRK